MRRDLLRTALVGSNRQRSRRGPSSLSEKEANLYRTYRTVNLRRPERAQSKDLRDLNDMTIHDVRPIISDE